MHLPSALWLTGILSVPVLAFNVSSWGQKAIDSGVVLKELNALASRNAYQRFNGKCNRKNVKVRKEWRNLSKSERRDYIKAFKCLLESPSILPAGEAPGAVSAFDDFIYLHLNVTPYIHFSGLFLPWHRYYIHGFEQGLQKCGYKGALAYWNHGLDVANLLASPIFDGSDTSLGGNGDPVPHGDSGFIFPGFTEVNILPAGPNGRGGGCVTTGPRGIAGMQTHLGPVGLPKYGEPGNLTVAANVLADNRRCLKRDLSEELGKKFATLRNTTDLILQTKNIFEFQTTLEGDPRYHPGNLGIHTAGHFMIGGDPGADMYISPGDPVFWLHHGQIDRLWWIWQNLDFENRQGLWGTHTLLNQPPSANVTTNETIAIGPTMPDVQIKKLMDTVSDDLFCYVYE
ncbi:Di-copper centre-containing protein, partial [Neurospora crassa]